MVIFKGIIKYIKISRLNFEWVKKRYFQDLCAPGVLLRFFAGSIACKYLIFSRNYPQRLNSLTQVHATKTDLYTIDSTWTEKGRKWNGFSIKYHDLEISMDSAQCLAILEVLHSILLKSVNEWINEWMNEWIYQPGFHLKSLKHHNLFFVSSNVLGKTIIIPSAVQLFQKCFLYTSRWQSLFMSHLPLAREGERKEARDWKRKGWK